MCDRLYVYAEDLWAWLDDNLQNLDARFNWLLDEWSVEDEDVLPGQPLLGLHRPGRRLTGQAMTWGVAAPWQSEQAPRLTLDADAIAKDEAGREWFAQGRCIVLATAYYPRGEAGGGTEALHRVRLASGWAMPLAGLYSADPEGHVSCSLLTCAAGDDQPGDRLRQPVIIPDEHVGRWLDSEIAAVAPLQDLLRPLVPGALVIESAGVLKNTSDPPPTSGPQLA